MGPPTKRSEDNLSPAMLFLFNTSFVKSTAFLKIGPITFSNSSLETTKSKSKRLPSSSLKPYKNLSASSKTSYSLENESSIFIFSAIDFNRSLNKENFSSFDFNFTILKFSSIYFNKISLTIALSMSFPPRAISPSLSLTTISPSSTLNKHISKVPPPKSKIKT